MKRLFTTLMIMLLAIGARSQLFILPYFTGTSAVGSYAITVTGAGSFTSGGASACLAPAADVYWIGPAGLGSYTYVLSHPVYRISVHAWGINGGPLGGGEYMSMFINGVVHPISAADVTSYTECAPGGGPCYLNAGNFMGPVGLTSDYNGGDIVITSATGITSFECSTNGITSGIAYAVYIDTSAVKVCEGDTLQLYNPGDSTGATYSWTGPAGFTSSLQDPFIFPVAMADSGLYQVIKTVAGVADTFSTLVKVYPKPVVNVTNNSPLCAAGISTLVLGVTPDSVGETFQWSGPSGYSSTLQNPALATFVAADTGMYYVYATTQYGCKDTGQTYVTTIPQPPTPVVTDMNYCQGAAFVPFTLDSIVTGDTVLWYTTAIGGAGSGTATVVNTAVPGLYNVWVSQKAGACESLRGTDSVRVTTTPSAPAVTGNMQYCQYIGPFTSLTVATTPTGLALWYLTATGGTGSATEPAVNLDVPGTYASWVSQLDSGCESLRTPVTITIHPKPDSPIVTLTPICQFKPGYPLTAAPSGTGDYLLWYGPGVTAASTTAPVPATVIAPDTTVYYVTETSIYGCVSDSAVDVQIVKIKPPLPVTRDIAYCQFDNAALLSNLVDSIGDARLNWYYNTVALPPIPRPSTDTAPGIYTWYVSQTINGCEGDSAAVNVSIVYKPQFSIAASSINVCQYDSIMLAYYGPTLPPAVAYHWTLPGGATTVEGTDFLDSMVYVRFDTASQDNYVYLHTSDDSGFCSAQDTIRINVIAQPVMAAYTKPDVCIGDSVELALTSASASADAFTWYIDNLPMGSSPAIINVAGSSNSGGPFEISWVDSGRHVIKVTSVSKEGCASSPAYDSVNVHPVPDASFRLGVVDSVFCLGDSVLFVANAKDYNYSYEWSPEDFFDNNNSPTIYGKMNDARSVVTLTVTDPFGCKATSGQELDPGACCTVVFPNAFTPNGNGNNDYFRPIATGYHNFHMFRIVNRWGVEVFNGGNSNTQWDGTYNGVPQDMGVYYYYVKYDCGGRTFEEKGDVTLIR